MITRHPIFGVHVNPFGSSISIEDLDFVSVNYDVDPKIFDGAGLDDLTSGGTFSADSADNVDYYVEIDGTGTPDTFKWSKDGGSTFEATTVAITGLAQTLDNGVTITFGATTGHTLADKWRFSARKYAVWTLDDLKVRRSAFTLQDDHEVLFDTGVKGWGYILVNDMQGNQQFKFNATTGITVIQKSPSSLFSVTDIDGDFCTLKRSNSLVLKNRPWIC